MRRESRANGNIRILLTGFGAATGSGDLLRLGHVGWVKHVVEWFRGQARVAGDDGLLCYEFTISASITKRSSNPLTLLIHLVHLDAVRLDHLVFTLSDRRHLFGAQRLDRGHRLNLFGYSNGHDGERSFVREEY